MHVIRIPVLFVKKTTKTSIFLHFGIARFQKQEYNEDNILKRNQM